MSAMPRVGAHPNSMEGPASCPPLWRLQQRGVTVGANSVPVTNATLVPSPFTSLAHSRSHLLQKKLLHHVVERAVQCWVIEQGRRRAEPAVKVNDLVVCVDIVILCDLLHPAHHHALQDPAREQKPALPHQP